MGRTASLPTALPERSFSPSLSLGRFNSAVFGGRLPADLAITWSATLTTTAGVTHYSRKNASDPNDFLAPPVYSARIELSSKARTFPSLGSLTLPGLDALMLSLVLLVITVNNILSLLSLPLILLPFPSRYPS